MKKIMKYIFITTLILFVSGCNDFLDLNPESNFGTTNNFYKSEKDVEYALTAAYANLQSRAFYRDYMVLMTDVRSDDLSSFGNTGGNAGREYSIKIFTTQSDNQIFREVWAKIYETIYRCNNVIKHVDLVDNEKLRNQYEAEARFIRALCYFNIIRLWGDAPLILTPVTPAEAATWGRNGVNEIYEEIETDLTFASDPEKLSKSFSGRNSGRATSIAAEGLLGKVYLQQKKWGEAKTTLETLINIDNQGTYDLLPDIADAFSTAPPNGSSNSEFNRYRGWKPQTMNKEILFAVLFNKDIVNEGRYALTYYTNQGDLNEELKLSSPTRVYDAMDRRVDLMRSIRGTNTDNRLFVKYGDIESSLSQFGYHTTILSWSDVLLMYAEAANEVNYDASPTSEALKALNEVRTRSFENGAYTTTNLSDQDSFRKAIWLERRLEFPMEMQRWFDLVRTGEAIAEIGKIGLNINAKDLLFPVPNSEVVLRNDLTKFPQNPRYQI